MKNKVGNIILIGVALFVSVSCKNILESKDKSKEATFQETWESLATIEMEPEWFKEAKFGIYFHWGVCSVPAFDSEWYPRWMYGSVNESNGYGILSYAIREAGHIRWKTSFSF